MTELDVTLAEPSQRTVRVALPVALAGTFTTTVPAPPFTRTCWIRPQAFTRTVPATGTPATLGVTLIRSVTFLPGRAVRGALTRTRDPAFQFVVHTERVHKMWRPVEFIMNTPSHHRVHHGSDALYLDRNYAGIFIIWDRMFGSFQEEINRPLYGLTKPVNTYNMVKLQTHEYVAIARDVKQAGTLREKLGYVFGPPGWTPETLDALKQAVAPDEYAPF